MKLYLPHIQTPPQVQAQTLPCGMTEAEWTLAQAIITHPDQQRAELTCDVRLVAAARAHAEAMRAANEPDHYVGGSPHQWIRRQGYDLPDIYPDDANYVESLSVGHPTAEGVFTALLNSPGHRKHLLAEHDFYREQSRMAVGFVPQPSPRGWRYWWVVLTCHAETE